MLTRESILAMEPGRELDRLVAEHVMGMDVVEDTLPQLPKYYLPEYEKTIFRDVPLFSSDISAAWEVFELNGIIGHVGYQGDEYVCTLWSHWDDKGYGVNAQAAAKTAPLAICRAALLTTISGEDKQ